MLSPGTIWRPSNCVVQTYALEAWKRPLGVNLVLVSPDCCSGACRSSRVGVSHRQKCQRYIVGLCLAICQSAGVASSLIWSRKPGCHPSVNALGFTGGRFVICICGLLVRGLHGASSANMENHFP